ncbi:hypothetical protein NW759_013508 [Fusarium solani]|nr:hypothetical protein NW759_013508 [Fusarium solani]
MQDASDALDDSGRAVGSVEWITSQRCPHMANPYGICVPIRTCLEYSTSCVECHLLLQVIEAFVPDWINAHKDGHGLIRFFKPVPYQVELFLGPVNEKARFPEDMQKISSFQFFHKSKGEHMYDECEPIYDEFARGPDGRPLYSKIPEPKNKLRLPRAQSLSVVEESFSQAAFDRVAKWLSYCLEHDEACAMPNPGFMPRRLIDVGSWDGSREPFLFRPCQPAPYACLSYCWGSDIDRILKTTTSNISSHHASIPMAKMPLAIQDAIIVCRGLKIRNLWVDSLCIPQDDPVAWLEDASQMDQIYLHSLLTISALEPSSCKSRFLGKQRYGDPEWQRRFVADLPPGYDEAPLEIFIRPTIDTDDDMSKKWSLDKRGWCLQESLLPNRRLCFTGDEMIWECLCRKICECGHILWRPQPFQFQRLATSFKAGRFKAKVNPSNPLPVITFYQESCMRDPERGNLSIAHERWRDIVTEYSSRSVSRRKDKLNALSGLAKLVRETLQADEYAAGLWKREFHFDLAWGANWFHPYIEPQEFLKPVTNQDTNRDDELGGIPSWSWASVDRPITYNFDEPLRYSQYTLILSNCVKVERLSCQTEPPCDETSAVISGKAVLTASMIPAKLVTDQIPCVQIQDRDKPIQVTWDRPKSVAVDDDLYCFRLFSWDSPDELSIDGGLEMEEPNTWFLVLRPSTCTTGAFRRVGMGSCNGDIFRSGNIVTVEIV